MRKHKPAGSVEIKNQTEFGKKSTPGSELNRILNLRKKYVHGIYCVLRIR